MMNGGALFEPPSTASRAQPQKEKGVEVPSPIALTSALCLAQGIQVFIIFFPNAAQQGSKSGLQELLKELRFGTCSNLGALIHGAMTLTF
jgi:hypothetical protein